MDNSKDIAKSLNKYSELASKGTNLSLDGIDNINKWYANELNKISENNIENSRLETNVDNSIEPKEKIETNKILTKVDDYTEIQTNNINKKNILNTKKIQTKVKQDIIKQDIFSKKIKNTKRISTAIKGAKAINNGTQKLVKTGKNISSGMNENSASSFKGESSRIMTKPVKKVVNKATSKINKKVVKYTKKASKKLGKKVVKETANAMIKLTKLIIKLIESVMKMIISMLPEIAPVIIIIVVIVAFCSFFGLGMSEDTKKNYEQYMMNIQNEYDKSTVDFYNSGKVVDGAIEGKGMINWKAPLAIVQMLNGDLTYDNAEKELLDKFKNAGLYERITDETYTYEKEITNLDGTKSKVTLTDSKKVVYNPSIDEYIDWCNNNLGVINNYKKKKKISYDSKQTRFTDDEIAQIKILYNSNMFFDLFSGDFKNRYAYLNVSIDDEQIQKIYNEFLNNKGKRYFMDHSNLNYDNCMDYYDCSSWVIHCLAHTGIKQIPNTTASGIYNQYCVPINVNDRQAGDLIFLKDTYNTRKTSVAYLI